MLVIIENISFLKSRIRLRISGDVERRHIGRLASLFDKCNSLNLHDIDIQMPETIDHRTLPAISYLASSNKANIVSDNSFVEETNYVDNSTSLFSHMLIDSSLGDAYNNHEYYFRTSNLHTASDEIQAIISIISETINLDDKSFYRLNLCVYELIANTIDHGVFSSAPPMISLNVKFTDDLLFVCYKDNSKEYILRALDKFDIKEKIIAKSTRGYGLFIMNCLTKDLSCRRVKNVNQTTFKIARPAVKAVKEQRRITMNQFSIKLASCDIKGSSIVKPIGSVDSMTTQSLEEQLNSLINNNTKYIIVDFSEVTFISSAGIGILLGTVSTLREDGGDLILMRIPSQIKEIFDILNISTYFITVDSIDELKESIHSKA